MMNLGELREHPDFARLVENVKQRVDGATDYVLVAACKASVEDIRYGAGGLNALITLLNDLERNDG